MCKEEEEEEEEEETTAFTEGIEPAAKKYGRDNMAIEGTVLPIYIFICQR